MDRGNGRDLPVCHEDGSSRCAGFSYNPSIGTRCLFVERQNVTRKVVPCAGTFSTLPDVCVIKASRDHHLIVMVAAYRRLVLKP